MWKYNLNRPIFLFHTLIGILCISIALPYPIFLEIKKANAAEASSQGSDSSELVQRLFERLEETSEKTKKVIDQALLKAQAPNTFGAGAVRDEDYNLILAHSDLLFDSWRKTLTLYLNKVSTKAMKDPDKDLDKKKIEIAKYFAVLQSALMVRAFLGEPVTGDWLEAQSLTLPVNEFEALSGFDEIPGFLETSLAQKIMNDPNSAVQMRLDQDFLSFVDRWTGGYLGRQSGNVKLYFNPKIAEALKFKTKSNRPTTETMVEFYKFLTLSGLMSSFYKAQALLKHAPNLIPKFDVPKISGSLATLLESSNENLYEQFIGRLSEDYSQTQLVNASPSLPYRKKLGERLEQLKKAGSFMSDADREIMGDAFAKDFHKHPSFQEELKKQKEDGYYLANKKFIESFNKFFDETESLDKSKEEQKKKTLQNSENNHLEEVKAQPEIVQKNDEYQNNLKKEESSSKKDEKSKKPDSWENYFARIEVNGFHEALFSLIPKLMFPIEELLNQPERLKPALRLIVAAAKRNLILSETLNFFKKIDMEVSDQKKLIALIDDRYVKMQGEIKDAFLDQWIKETKEKINPEEILKPEKESYLKDIILKSFWLTQLDQKNSIMNSADYSKMTLNFKVLIQAVGDALSARGAGTLHKKWLATLDVVPEVTIENYQDHDRFSAAHRKAKTQYMKVLNALLSRSNLRGQFVMSESGQKRLLRSIEIEKEKLFSPVKKSKKIKDYKQRDLLSRNAQNEFDKILLLESIVLAGKFLGFCGYKFNSHYPNLDELDLDKDIKLAYTQAYKTKLLEQSILGYQMTNEYTPRVFAIFGANTKGETPLYQYLGKIIRSEAELDTLNEKQLHAQDDRLELALRGTLRNIKEVADQVSQIKNISELKAYVGRSQKINLELSQAFPMYDFERQKIIELITEEKMMKQMEGKLMEAVFIPMHYLMPLFVVGIFVAPFVRASHVLRRGYQTLHDSLLPFTSTYMQLALLPIGYELYHGISKIKEAKEEYAEQLPYFNTGAFKGDSIIDSETLGQYSDQQKVAVAGFWSNTLMLGVFMVAPLLFADIRKTFHRIKAQSLESSMKKLKIEPQEMKWSPAEIEVRKKLSIEALSTDLSESQRALQISEIEKSAKKLTRFYENAIKMKGKYYTDFKKEFEALELKAGDETFDLIKLEQSASRVNTQKAHDAYKRLERFVNTEFGVADPIYWSMRASMIDEAFANSQLGRMLGLGAKRFAGSERSLTIELALKEIYGFNRTAPHSGNAQSPSSYAEELLKSETALGLEPNSGYSFKEVRSKFRKLAVQFHPDKNPGNKAAEEKFKDINNAHDFFKRHFENERKAAEGVSDEAA